MWFRETIEKFQSLSDISPSGSNAMDSFFFFRKVVTAAHNQVRWSVNYLVQENLYGYLLKRSKFFALASWTIGRNTVSADYKTIFLTFDSEMCFIDSGVYSVHRKVVVLPGIFEFREETRGKRVSSSILSIFQRSGIGKSER